MVIRRLRVRPPRWAIEDDSPYPTIHILPTPEFKSSEAQFIFWTFWTVFGMILFGTIGDLGSIGAFRIECWPVANFVLILYGLI